MNKKMFAVMACEFRILYSDRLLFASSLIIFIIGVFISKTGSTVALALSLYGIMSISMNIFAIIEKHNSERYITSLPIKRGEIVVAKYINILLISFVYFILVYVIDILRVKLTDKQSFIPSSFFVIFFFCILIYVAISFPFCFRYGFGRARFLMMIVLVAPLFLQGVIMGFSSSNLNSSADSVLIGSLSNMSSISLHVATAFISSSIIIFILSIPLSILFYKKRDL